MSRAVLLRWLLILIPIVLMLTADSLSAQPLDASETLSPYFVLTDGDPELDRLPLLGTEVSFQISGVIADVTVKQSYKNQGSRPIHAKYVFPASTRAAVHGLTMTVGNERVIAKIRERQQAKAEFAAARKEGKNAALLEQQRPNVFTMNIANIMPGQQIDVELRYSELLVPTGGVYEFVYPTVVGPRYSDIPAAGAADNDRWLKSPYTAEGEPPTYTLTVSGSISAGMPIDALASPSHGISANWIDQATVGISLDVSEIKGGNRDFVLHYRLDGGRIQTGLLLHQGEIGNEQENFFLALVQPPRRVAPEQIPPREYVFVVDVSGSMNGFPLNTSKELLRNLIGDLRVSDTFNVLFFAGGSQVWSPRSEFATQTNIDSAVQMLEHQRGGGGTNLLAAVKRAMELPREGNWSRNIIVVTDGYIGAEKNVFSYIRQNLNNANVFAFGIGSSVNRFLIEGIARAGMGEPFVVTQPAEAQETATRFKNYVQFPVLTDIKVTFDGFDAYDIEPASIPDVLADRPILVQGKWRGHRGGRIVVTGVSGEGDYQSAFDVQDGRLSSSNSALRYLWARTRIANISDFSFAGETEEEKQQLIELGLTYNLLTSHTSFIAVREVIENVSGDATNVTQPLPLPLGVSNLAVGMGKGSEPALPWLLALALSLLTLMALGRSRLLPRR